MCAFFNVYLTFSEVVHWSSKNLQKWPHVKHIILFVVIISLLTHYDFQITKCFSCFSVEAMQAYVDAGLTTFDMADIYGPAEQIFGLFSSQVHTYSFQSDVTLSVGFLFDSTLLTKGKIRLALSRSTLLPRQSNLHCPFQLTNHMFHEFWIWTLDGLFCWFGGSCQAEVSLFHFLHPTRFQQKNCSPKTWFSYLHVSPWGWHFYG